VTNRCHVPRSTTHRARPGAYPVGRRLSPKRATAIDKAADKVNTAKQAALLQQTKAEVVANQLSLFDLAPWANDMRAMPNDLARAALFTTRNKRTPRDVRQQHVIFHVNKDVQITYTGIELRADDDELVWLQVLEYAKRTPVGQPVTFTFYELCNDLGWAVNGGYYDKAEKCLTRLQATAFQISSTRIGHLESVSLLSRFRVLERGKKNSRCQVEIDSEMVILFAGDHYTKFIWEKYRNLFRLAQGTVPVEAGDVSLDVWIGLGQAQEMARAEQHSGRRVDR
jgi:hypothetical protein